MGLYLGKQLWQGRKVEAASGLSPKSKSNQIKYLSNSRRAGGAGSPPNDCRMITESSRVMSCRLTTHDCLDF